MSGNIKKKRNKITQLIKKYYPTYIIILFIFFKYFIDKYFLFEFFKFNDSKFFPKCIFYTKTSVLIRNYIIDLNFLYIYN